ncbi:uncharacterized protein [Diadema setosum]|uniref:uncharacterized protein n=1 Tax=Diadema setosum TaxID=31175 RepID=UPI003B3A0735
MEVYHFLLTLSLLLIIWPELATPTTLQNDDSESIQTSFNYSGTSFAFSFLAHESIGTQAMPVIEIVPAVTENTTVEVGVAAISYKTIFTLQPGDSKRLNLNLNTSDLFGNKDATIVVNSSSPVGVAALVMLLRPSAAFQVIPESQCGTHYVIMSQRSITRKSSQFTITSHADANNITIDSLKDVFHCRRPAESRTNMVVLLNKHKTIFCEGVKADFTGTTIRSTYPVSVVAGSNRVRLSEGGHKGYIIEQMPPVTSWGNNFAVAPFAKLARSSYELRLLVPQGSVAEVTMQGANWTRSILLEGIDHVRNFSEVIEISSNRSILVMQYMTGQANDDRSDPSMFLVPPLKHNQQHVLVEVFESSLNENVVNIIVECNETDGLLVDGRHILDSNVIARFNGTRYCGLAVQVDSGIHCFSHGGADFHAVLYSWKIRNGQNSYTLYAGLGVPVDYPTCIPEQDMMINPEPTEGDTQSSTILLRNVSSDGVDELKTALGGSGNSDEISKNVTALELWNAIQAVKESGKLCKNLTYITSNFAADAALALENLALDLARDMINRNESSLVRDFGVAVIKIKALTLTASDTATHVSTSDDPDSSVVETRASFPLSVIREMKSKALVSILFRSLGGMIDMCTVAADVESSSGNSTSNGVVGSEVLSLNLYPPISTNITFNEPVQMDFPLHRMEVRSNHQPALCSFWNYDIGAWSQEGCEVDFSNDTHVQCSCRHLTNFAVLMQVANIELSAKHDAISDVISTTGCGLSIAGALLTICIYLFLRLKSDRVLIHTNLCVAVGAAQVVFLCLDASFKSQVACTVVATLLYYFYMAAFCWMLIEGVNLYLKAVIVFSKPGSKMRIYLTIGWGCPLIPLVVILGYYRGQLGDDVTQKSDPLCFLRPVDHSIWFFIVPVLSIIMLNLFLVARVVWEIVKLAGGPHVINNRITRAKHGVKACVILLPVMGLTWLFGVLWMNGGTVIFMYLFTVFNSLQGVFIFIFHCLLNSEVQHAFLKKKEKWLYSLSFSRRITFNLRTFQSDDSRKRQQNGDTNKLSAANPPNNGRSPDNCSIPVEKFAKL